MPSNQIPNRLTEANPQTISDIYDKLNFLLSKQSAPASTTNTTSSSTSVTTKVIDISGATGQAATPQLSFIPILTAVPSDSPSLGAPYAVNGLIISVNNQFWVYVGAPTYQWQQISTATILLNDTHANRVLSYLPVTYPHALFFETDTGICLLSNGTSWLTVSGEIRDTHANRLALWPSVQYSDNTPFYETDRTVYYRVEDCVGTVSTAGTAVTRTGGNHFINTGTGFNAAQWPAGTPITINGVTYSIASVSDDAHLTLSATAGTQTGVAYTVTSGRWIYLSGQFPFAQIGVPTDLGENDNGFLMDVLDYAHVIQWSASSAAFIWGPGESGGMYLQFFAVAPTGFGWAVCNGATASYLLQTGLLGSVTLPSEPAYIKAAGSYAPSITAKVVPTISGVTELASTGITVSAAAAASAGSGSINNPATGTPVTVLEPPFTGGGGGGVVTDPQHQHTLNSTDAPIALPGDPIPNFTALLYFRQ